MFELVLAAALLAQNWPAFRGPDATGVAATAAPPATWDLASSKNVAWKTTIPGLAHSSPIVWGTRIYVATAVPSRGTVIVATGDISKAGIDPANDMVSHTWRLLAIDKASGRIVWDKAVHQGVPRMKRHVKSSHASATPATDGRVIVALLDSEGLFCFDMDGVQKWRADLGVMDVGLVDDLSAYDAKTGARIYQNRVGPGANGFSASPVAAGGRIYLASEDGAVFVVQAGRTFELLATNPMNEILMATPAISGDMLMLIVRTLTHLIGIKS